MIEWVPTESDDVVQDAEPPESATDAQPAIAVPPSLKLTVPVGVPLEPETDALKVTGWPEVDGFCEEPSETVAVAFVAAVTVKAYCCTLPRIGAFAMSVLMLGPSRPLVAKAWRV